MQLVARQTVDPGVTSSPDPGPVPYIREIILPPSADSRRHDVLVNCLVKLAQEKRVVYW